MDSTDQDANPELAIRYKNYGWPATIFINGKGEDVVKRASYISPKYFLKLLKAIVADPTSEINEIKLSKINSSSASEKTTIANLKEYFEKSLDYDQGGFDQAQKYIDYDTYEYALFQSKNKAVKSWIQLSVEGAKNLSDPEWGGIYQYSTHNDWQHLHFEKLLSIQARYIQIFSYYHFYFNDPNALKYVKSTLDYCDQFLRMPNGLYANAQDADLNAGDHAEHYFSLNDKERLKLGIPKIDTNTYTNRNADFASSLMLFYFMTEGDGLLKNVKEIIKHLECRQNTAGLFYHSGRNKKIISLNDNLAMAKLYTQLLKLNFNDSETSKKLEHLLKAIHENFSLKNGSYKSFIGDNGLQAEPIIDENIQLGRAYNWYAQFSEKSNFKSYAKEIYNFLIQPQVVNKFYSEPAILSLQAELENEASQFVFLDNGDKENSFYNSAKAYANYNSLFYIYQPEELPKEKKELFSGFYENTLFVCTSNTCSPPIFNKKEITNYFLNK